MFNIDTYRSKKQILEELRVASSRAIEDGNVAHMTVTFAVLLVKLSDDVEYAARKVIRLTRMLFWLSILFTIVILPPLIQELYEFFLENTFYFEMPELPDMPDFSEYFSSFWRWFSEFWNDIWRQR